MRPRPCRVPRESCRSRPSESVGVLLQDGVWHFTQVVGHEAEILRELVEDLLPVSHWSPPFPYGSSAHMMPRTLQRRYGVLSCGSAGECRTIKTIAKQLPRTPILKLSEKGYERRSKRGF